MAYWSGSMAGKAIAETLFGINNPSGKLPFTYPKYSGNLATYDLKYSSLLEDLGKGDTETGYDVQYPFAFGLSYTVFEYSNLKADHSFERNEELKVSVVVKNTGKVEGTEIVELFTWYQYSSITSSVKRLRYFKRAKLKHGESRTVFLLSKTMIYLLLTPNIIV